MDNYEILAEFFKALAHPSRLKILDILTKERSSVCNIAEKIKEKQPQVSRSLVTLKHSGIVIPEKKGTTVCYKVKNKEIFEIIKLAKQIIKKEGKEILDAIE